MSKPNEWAKRCEPDSPATVVAKDAIESRLQSVWRFAQLAANGTNRGDEDVHQLRVGVRRAGAALTLYSPVLPPAKRREFRKKLKALRKAAGPARDLDVLAQRIEGTKSRLPKEGFNYLQELIQDLRRKAQRKLKRSYRVARKNGFEKSSVRLVKKIRWRGDGREPVFGKFARVTFQPILERFFEAASADLRDVRNLHQMRIAGKDVRYAMELLAPAFGKSFRKEIYPVFTQVQDKLGAINDHASAIRFYRELRERTDQKKCQEVIESMIRLEESELGSSRDLFMEWWTPERTADMESQFETLLRLPSRDREQENSLPHHLHTKGTADSAVEE